MSIVDMVQKNYRWKFLITVFSLVFTGLVFIYSSSSIFALEAHGSAGYFVYKQLIGLLIGLVALGVCAILPSGLIRLLSPVAFWSMLVCTALTLVPQLSMHIHGSSRWLRIGGFGFQPSEFLKVALVLYVAYLLDRKKYQKKSFWRSFLPLGIVFGASAVVLLLQPDFGSVVVLGATIFLLLIIANFKAEYLIASAAMLIPAGVLLVVFKKYRLQRILTFLNPWQDPQGSGFQIIQSLIAVGSGGLWGVGISNSKQKFFYLPMQHTDFIFAIIAEEVGFVGSSIVVFLYALFLYFGMRLAWQMQSEFATYTTLGGVILISLQAIINLFVVTGLFPTKGVGLPFISYGNTSLIACLVIVGIIIGCAAEGKNSY